mmetsp:Transcript_9629/g.22616  ORF Transcript_9629/g.22616 Transcript_9629/m.22616 type:complete len:104 (+) Transcript_9629:329-640(+)
MPLARRLAAELRPEWKNHCIRYKELQRRAEALVGETNEEEEYVFRNHLECAVERTNDFFLIKVQQVQANFDAISASVEAIAQVHGGLNLQKDGGAGATLNPKP